MSSPAPAVSLLARFRYFSPFFFMLGLRLRFRVCARFVVFLLAVRVGGFASCYFFLGRLVSRPKILPIGLAKRKNKENKMVVGENAPYQGPTQTKTKPHRKSDHSNNGKRNHRLQPGPTQAHKTPTRSRRQKHRQPTTDRETTEKTNQGGHQAAKPPPKPDADRESKARI